MQGQLPQLWTFCFYALIVWAMSAVLVAFRLLAQNEGVATGLRVGALVWLGLPALLASLGAFQNFDARPPVLMRVLLPMVVLIVAFVISPWGKTAAQRLPLSLLVGTQLFRLPLEILLYGLSLRGFLPREMTMAGFNYDIVTGVAAGSFWFFMRRGPVPQWSIWIWNVFGFLALLAVVTIAVLSFPQPFGLFFPPNEIVAYYPWVWLPTFLVQVALVSHLLVFRKLLAQPDPLWQ